MNLEKVVDKNIAEPVFQNLRFERKFVYTASQVGDIIENTVLSNSFGFSEIYERRSVNNIYLDDQSFSFYTQNVSGDHIREKYRFRWYGDDFSEINNPTLEIKKKFGDVGDKVSLNLNNFNLNIEKCAVDKVYETLVKEIATMDAPQFFNKLQILTPTLYNSYERRYFLSDCGKFRITIDYNMLFYNPQFKNYKTSEMGLTDIVLELKYKREYDDESRQLSQEIDCRLSKNSKYVRGIENINS